MKYEVTLKGCQNQQYGMTLKVWKDHKSELTPKGIDKLIKIISNQN